MSNCLECHYAEWERTKTGRLSPSGDGSCTYKVNIIIPRAFYWIGGGEIRPYGGHINRKYVDEHCPTWTKLIQEEK